MKTIVLSMLAAAVASTALAGNPTLTLEDTSSSVTKWQVNLLWTPWQSDWSSVDGIKFRAMWSWNPTVSGTYLGTEVAIASSGFATDPLIIPGDTVYTYAPLWLTPGQVYAVRIWTEKQYLYHRPTGDVYSFQLDSGDLIHAWNSEAIVDYRIGPNWSIEYEGNIGSWLTDAMIYATPNPYFGTYWGDDQ